MSKYHKKAIDIITNPGTNFAALCVEIAKHNPHALIRADFALKHGDYIDEIKAALEISTLEAVKVCRRHTGMSLREAKDFVDSLDAKL